MLQYYLFKKKFYEDFIYYFLLNNNANNKLLTNTQISYIQSKSNFRTVSTSTNKQFFISKSLLHWSTDLFETNLVICKIDV